MFAGLIKRLFTGAKDQSKKTESREPIKTAQPPAAAKPQLEPIRILSEEELRWSEGLFYEVMFRETKNKGDELEQKILQQLRKVLEDVDKIANEVVQLPSVVLEIDQAMQQEDFDTAKITRLIEREPVMAGQVLKLANSPLFKPGENEINSIQQAITYMGVHQVHELVIVAALQQMSDTPRIYYRFFGQQIWQHSLQTAEYARHLAGAVGIDPFAAYFTGLVHDIGKIAIFRVLVDQIRKTDPDFKPTSHLFKMALTESSITLSAAICREWGLPNEVCVALDAQKPSVTSRSGMDLVLYQANLYSELVMVRAAGLSDLVTIKSAARARGLDTNQLVEWMKEAEA